MHTLGSYFDALLRKIRPPENRLEAARDLPARVREFLEKREDFVTLKPHTRLAGSYAQATTVGDVKDVDFLVRVDGDPEESDPKPSKAITDLESVLNDLPTEMGYEGFVEVDVQKARRSVHVYIPSSDFHLDVVPCIAPNGFDEVLYVPDRGWGCWIPSHPIGFVDHLHRVNVEKRQKVKPLIRLLKHFRNHHMVYMRPKSYWLSALVLQEMGELDDDQSLAELFFALLAGIHSRYDHLLWTSDSATPSLSDPMLGHDISWNWSRGHFETFMRRIEDGRSWAEEALDEQDRDAAVALWQKVFGEDNFPASVDERAQSLAAAATPGVAFISPTGLVSGTKPANSVAVKSQHTTFHGTNK
ncbi:MAG: nucleotidyltransferase domain-containing protein [Thermoleophilia bacterium]